MSLSPASASARTLRWLPWAAIAALLVVRLCHEWFGPDIWYHLALGERIARTGTAQPADTLSLQQPGFVNFYWLFQLLVRGAFALGGIFSVSALFIAVWLAAFAFWLRATGAWRAPPWGAALALAAVLVCQTRFEERPEIFSYLLLALQIDCLANWKLDATPRPQSLAGFTLTQILWSNLHGYFVLGPLLVAAKIVSVAIDTPRADWPRVRAAWRGLWLLAALTIAATFVSPFGLRNGSGVLALWRFFGAMRHEVQEFLPPTGTFLALSTVKLFWLGWAAALLAALGTLFFAARRETFAIVLAAAGLWLSATSFRNIPLFVFFTAPLAGVVLPRLAVFRPLEKFSALAISALALGLATLAIGSPVESSGFGIRTSPAASPLQFAEYLRTHGFSGTLFNHPGDGGYLEFYFPALRLYGDSRYVEAEPVHDYFAALHRPEAFRALDGKHHFDAALFKLTESRPVLVALINDPRWRIAYADLQRVLLVNTASAAGAAAPIEPPVFYRGEDLSGHASGEAALQWAGLFAEANRPDDLLYFLSALGAAPRIPAPVIEVALRYGLAIRHAPILALARTLRPKMIVAKPADATVVDRLLAQAAAP
jgi:hypothetical protein